MSSPKCSDHEFIAIWNNLHSAAAVAKQLGLDPTVVATRRRRIEKRHGIILAAIDPYGRKAYDQSMLVTADRIEVKLKIRDGVILVSGDQHYFPGHIPVMHKALCYLTEKIKPFAVVWNGDAADFGQISRFPSIGWENKPSLNDELECLRDRSNEVIEASVSSKHIWNAGNHDLRFESRLAQVAPEYRDIQGIHLKDHIPEWQPAWFTTVNDGEPSHTEIRHREKGGVHAGYNNTVSSGVSIVTGHDHRADVVPFDDRRGRRYAVRHGMGADSSRDAPFVHYLEGRRTNWQSGLAVLTYKDGMLLYPELALRVDEKSFQFRGEVINV